MSRSRPSVALVGFALAALFAGSASAADNRVESVDVRKADGRIEVLIRTAAPPTFQSYSRRSPAVVIVDLVDTDAGARRIASPGAPIEEIALEPKKGRSSDVARLWVRFSAPVEYDVVAYDDTVKLTVFPNGKAPRPVHEVDVGALDEVSSGTPRPRLAAHTPPTSPRVRTDAVSPRLAQADDEEDFDDGDEGSAGMATGIGDPTEGLAMSYIGFKNRKGESEIYARMNGRAKFEVKREGENLMVLEIPNARIPLRNNKNHLDTTFFESPVKMITPTEVDDAPPTIRIIIEMREEVPYETRVRGNDVVVVFKKGG